MPARGTPGLSDRDRNKLVRCLRLLSSDHVGEIAAAGAAAHRIVSGLSLDWADVVATSAPVVVTDPPKQAGWYADVQRCLHHPEALTAWELGFLNSIARRARPSLKQLAVLAAIVGKVPA